MFTRDAHDQQMFGAYPVLLQQTFEGGTPGSTIGPNRAQLSAAQVIWRPHCGAPEYQVVQTAFGTWREEPEEQLVHRRCIE